MIGILVTAVAGLLTYVFLSACERLGCWLEKQGLGVPALHDPQSADTPARKSGKGI